MQLDIYKCRRGTVYMLTCIVGASLRSTKCQNKKQSTVKQQTFLEHLLCSSSNTWPIQASLRLRCRLAQRCNILRYVSQLSRPNYVNFSCAYWAFISTPEVTTKRCTTRLQRSKHQPMCCSLNHHTNQQTVTSKKAWRKYTWLKQPRWLKAKLRVYWSGRLTLF